MELKALTWGPADGPIALCLHGFPDTAYGWRKVAPRLAESGWRVVAPFMRGYAPSSIPSDGSYHIGALMDDALQMRAAIGGTDRDVVIGHDWGAMAANGLGRDSGQPFRQGGDHVGAPGGGISGPGARDRPIAGPDPAAAAAELVHHVLPIALAARAFRVLGAAATMEEVVAELRRQSRSAARRCGDRHTGELARRARAYRAAIRNTRPPTQYRDLHRHWMSRPKLPSLYLHGRDDGCMTSAFTRWIPDALPDDSDVTVVDNAGHFLQLDEPDKVADLVLGFIGSAK